MLRNVTTVCALNWAKPSALVLLVSWGLYFVVWQSIKLNRQKHSIPRIVNVAI